MAKIFIDPGHGGTDPGAVANGLREKDLTLTISKKIESILKGVATVKLSRTNDKTLSLAQRTKMANDWGADYFLSVHINAGGGTGYEDFIYNGSVSSKTVSIRNTIHAEIVKQIPEVRNRGKKRANFAVVRSSKMPAMLTENLFIDTKADADLLKNNAFLDKVAVGHANGLIKAFNLKGSVGKPTTSKPKAKAPSKSKPTSSGSVGLGLVDWMKSKKMDSSFNNRKKLASQHGISNYKGTAAQNNSLLSKLKGGSSGSSSSSSSKKYPLPTGVLRRGSKGNGVKQLQRALNAANFKCGAVDGIYGAKVEDAVRRFQSVYDAYNVDGEYGSRTRSRLDKQVN